MDAKGRVYKFGDNIDTDVIIPARYLNTQDMNELATHCMEYADPDFATKVNTGDIMVAGENFGCGSSREHAPASIKALGIGLPILECPEASIGIDDGDDVSVDFNTGVITNNTKGETYQAAPFPDFIKQIIASGGLLNSIK